MSDCKLPSLKFSVRAKLISVNNFYYADKRHGLRPEAKEMQYKIFHAIMQPDVQSQFEILRSQFDASKHAYGIDIVQYVPKSVLYTKSGHLSSKSQDITNCEKGLVDALFLSKYYGENVPYQAKNLNTDDRYLIEMSSCKRAATDDNFSVDVEIYIRLLP